MEHFEKQVGKPQTRERAYDACVNKRSGFLRHSAQVYPATTVDVGCEMSEACH